MALILPTNFANNVQGKDTNLIPLVTISHNGGDFPDGTEGMIISTNEYNGEDGTNAHPLLLNIPTLKESIDIEKTRKYKINSINVDISNFPNHEGIRFSDHFNTQSLINAEVRIYWISPSGYVIYDSPNLEDESSALMIYFGNIRKYEHDIDKCRIVVEDKSQETFHKDLPIANLGTGVSVPDNYKNKVVPIVIGNVDRSPCVMEDKNTLLADIDTRVKIKTDATYDHADRHTQSGLFWYNNIYAEVVSQTSGITYGSISQWTNSANKINFPTIAGINSNPVNLLDDNQLEVRYIAKPTKVKGMDWTDFNITGDINTKFLDRNNLFDDNAYNYAKINDPDTLIAIVNPSTGAMAHFIIEYNTHFGETAEVYKSGLLLNVLLHTSTYDTPGSGDIGWTIQIIDHRGEGSHEVFVLDDKRDGRYNNASYYDLEHTSDNFQYDTSEYDVIHFPYDNGTIREVVPSSMRMNVAGDYQDGTCIFLFKLATASWMVNGEYKFKDLSSIDFYANVDGRLTNPTAPRVIEEIMNTELDQSLSLEDDISYSGWRYDFTVDSKIGSKKLLENLVSTSPYMARYNNMGDFKFTSIPKTGGELGDSDGNVSDNHIIDKDSVIDFSFSRTSILDVYTQVEFKYNWDYARKQFSNRRIANVDNFVCFDVNGEQYDYGYYGLDSYQADGSHHKTLVIDDRGKYIRDDETAERYVTWMLSWHMNQHLKMKLKLAIGKGLNLEIGDIIQISNETDGVLGGVEPYGINYTKISNIKQSYYPKFIITETNKSLDSVTISCMQLHELWDNKGEEWDGDLITGWSQVSNSRSSMGCSYIYGCRHENACNHDCSSTANPNSGVPCSDGVEIDDGSCKYPVFHCYDNDGDLEGSFEGGADYCVGNAPSGFTLNCDDDCEGTADCAGECNGSHWESPCGCVSADNDGNDCNDCNGEPNGDALIDDCGVCSGGNSGHIANSDDLGCGCFKPPADDCSECYDTGSDDDNYNTTCVAWIKLQEWHLITPSTSILDKWNDLENTGNANGNHFYLNGGYGNNINLPSSGGWHTEQFNEKLKVSIKAGGLGFDTDDDGNIIPDLDIHVSARLTVERTISAYGVTSAECVEIYKHDLSMVFDASSAVDGVYTLTWTNGQVASGGCVWIDGDQRCPSNLPSEGSGHWHNLDLFKPFYDGNATQYLYNTTTFNAHYIVNLEILNYQIDQYGTLFPDAGTEFISTADIGHEFWIYHYPSVIDCPYIDGDVTGQGGVACGDFYLAQEWLSDSSCVGYNPNNPYTGSHPVGCCAADLNGDGTFTDSELAWILANAGGNCG